jgi:hypothetical protein
MQAFLLLFLLHVNIYYLSLATLNFSAMCSKPKRTDSAACVFVFYLVFVHCTSSVRTGVSCLWCISTSHTINISYFSSSSFNSLVNNHTSELFQLFFRIPDIPHSHWLDCSRIHRNALSPTAV